MSEYIFKMPDIGEGVVEAEITAWYIKVGEMVEEDTPVADAMTDKATVELTAPVTGRVISVGCAEGEIMAIGGDLVVFETDGDVPSPKPAPKKEEVKTAPQIETPKPTPIAKPAAKPAPAPTPRTGAKPLASPAVRKSAMDQDIDLSLVTPTGKAGQITHEDLQAFEKGGISIYQKKTGVTEVKVIGMRRVIAQRMAESKRNIPHFSYVESIDMTEV
ncbi:MAG: hypothetical protein COA43_02050, partial [Robiginitomaculum sp.]